MRREMWNAGLLVFTVVALAIGGPWLVREVKSLPGPALAARANQRIVTLEVGGMTCNHCAAAVTAQLAQVQGVATVDVRYRQRRAYVVCEKATADSSLTAAVSRAGPGFLAAIAER